VGDLRPQSQGGEYSLDVGTSVTIAAVKLQTVVDIEIASDCVLEREHHEAIRPQRSCGGGEDALQIPKYTSVSADTIRSKASVLSRRYSVNSAFTSAS
jgi:hypothetical protein